MPVPERPGGAVAVPAGLLVPSESLAALLVVLRRYRDLAHGVSPPGAAAQPRWTPPLAALLDVVADAAVEYQRDRYRGTAATVPPAVNVAVSAAPEWHPGLSEGEVGVERAAEILGVSPRRVRVLAARGELVARRAHVRLKAQQGARTQWLINEAAVHAHRRGVA